MTETIRPETQASTANDEGPFASDERGCTLLIVTDAGVRAAELLRGGVLRVGRSAESDISVDHPAVSRNHAVFYGTDPPEVEDLGSRNGTTVQGTLIAAGQRVPLRRGYVVGLGSVNIFVRGRGSQADDFDLAPSEGPGLPGAVLEPPSRHIAMHELYERARAVAQSSIPVLVLGETGVGKELLTETVHAWSPRSMKPLLRVNCAGLAEGILASELFGHEKGAFTGAHATKVGLFEAADGGTIFLDEVGEMAPTTQAQLLRVLETGEVTRVGSHRSRKVDVRVVSATNRDLRRMIGRGQFRADLYFRLNGVSLQIPPLRERLDDILPLAEHFAERCARHLGAPRPVFADGAQAALRRYRWPGNVRELKHVIERAIVLCSDGVLGADLLQLEGAFGREPLTTFPPDSGYSSENMRVAERVPEGRRHESAPPSRGTFDPPRSPRHDPQASHDAPRSPREVSMAASQRAEQLRAELARAERDRILDALRRSGTQAEAAKLLGISRRALIYRLEAYAIPRPRKDKPKI